MDIDFLTVILVLGFAALGYVFGIRTTMAKFETGELYIEYDEDYVDDEGNALEVDDISAYLEMHDGLIFVYNERTHAYLSHGTSLDELTHKLADRFPSTRFAISRENLEELGLV